MDPLSLRLLLLAHVCLSARQGVLGQQDITINSLVLTISPGLEVNSDTDVEFKCVCDASYAKESSPIYKFSLNKDDSVIHSIQQSSNTMTYLLRNVRVYNSGEYRCQADILSLSKESKSMSLKVTGVETPFFNVFGGEVFEGGKLAAECRAPKERGPILFMFYGNSTKVKKVPSQTNSVQTQLQFEKWGMYDVYCQYVLKEFQVSSNRSDSRVVSVRELVITPEINVLPSGEIVEGGGLEIHCMVRGLPMISLDLKIYVIKGHTILKTGSREASWNTTSVLAKDSGNYTCKSEANDVQKSTSRSVQVAELFSKPELTMSEDVFEGETLTFACKSARIHTQQINMADVKYYLYKDNVYLTVLPSGKRSVTANMSHNGNYSCQAVAKSIQKNSSKVALKTKVLVSEPLVRVSGSVVLGRPFSIVCQSEQGSLPIHYTLFKGTKVVSSLTVHPPQDQAVFNVSVKSENEIKDFTCHAQNRGPKSNRKSRRLSATVIVPVSKPQLMADPYDGNVVEGNDLIFFCTVNEGSPPFKFKWFHDGTFLEKHDTEQMKDTYNMTKVEPKQWGRYHCLVQNKAGESQRSTEITVRVHRPVWKTAIVVTAVIIPVVAFFIGFLIYCKATKGQSKEETEINLQRPRPASVTVAVSETPDSKRYSKVPSDDMKPDFGQSDRLQDTDNSDSDDQSSCNSTEQTALVPADGVPAEAADSAEGAVNSDSVVYAQLNHAKLKPKSSLP